MALLTLVDISGVMFVMVDFHRESVNARFERLLG